MSGSKERIMLKDMQGREIGVFMFDPCDAGLLGRISGLIDVIPGIVRPLRKISITPEGAASGKDSLTLWRVEKRLYAAIDKTFGKGTAENIFRQMRPFAIVKGNFWCLNVVQLCKIATDRVNAKREEDRNGSE